MLLQRPHFVEDLVENIRTDDMEMLQPVAVDPRDAVHKAGFAVVPARARLPRLPVWGVVIGGHA
jgi:hypothetical protein